MPAPDIEFLALPKGKIQGSSWFYRTEPGRQVEIRRDGDQLEIRDHFLDRTERIGFDLSEAARLHHGLGIMLAGPNVS